VRSHGRPEWYRLKAWLARLSNGKSTRGRASCPSVPTLLCRSLGMGHRFPKTKGKPESVSVDTIDACNDDTSAASNVPQRLQSPTVILPLTHGHLFRVRGTPDRTSFLASADNRERLRPQSLFFLALYPHDGDGGMCGPCTAQRPTTVALYLSGAAEAGFGEAQCGMRASRGRIQFSVLSLRMVGRIMRRGVGGCWTNPEKTRCRG
jgi:hypothetical protein